MQIHRVEKSDDSQLMKIGVYSLAALSVVGLVLTYAQDDSTRARERQIKAAFLYNFVKFTEWPAGKLAEPNMITIGLLGEHLFMDAFDPVRNKSIGDKRLIIKDLGRFHRFSPQNDASSLEFVNYIEQLRKCHILFICDSERDNFKAIIDAVKGYRVLTVGETEDFLDIGGIITFIPGTDKPVFDVNLNVCRREGLEISSKVLRLARRIISDKDIAPRHDE